MKIRRVLRTTIPALAAAALALSLTACGSNERLTAEQVVSGLSDAGLPVQSTVVFTAETDPNGMLGRPGGYDSKAAWADERIDDVVGAAEGDVRLGGGVEVFTSRSDAVERGTYIQTVTGAGVAFLGTEYDYVSGPVLLRLSGELTPSQAEDYASALAKLTGDETALLE